MNNPQEVSHDGATVAEYNQLREQNWFSNMNCGFLSRCIGPPSWRVVQISSPLVFHVLEWCLQSWQRHAVWSKCWYLCWEWAFAPGRVLQIWDISQDLPNTWFTTPFFRAYGETPWISLTTQRYECMRLAYTSLLTDGNRPNIAIEHHNFQWENSLFLWPCSIAI